MKSKKQLLNKTCTMFIVCFALFMGVTSCSSDDFKGYGPEPKRMTDAELVEQQLKIFHDRPQTRAGVDSLICVFITTKSDILVLSKLNGCLTIDWGDNSPEESFRDQGFSTVVNITHSYTDGPAHTVAIYGDPTVLNVLCIDNNEVIYADITKCTSLEEFYTTDNRLRFLDIRSNLNIKVLCAYRNPYLSELDVSNNDQLEMLIIEDCNISSIDVSNLTELEYLWCGGSASNPVPMSGLNVINNTKLRHLYCINANLNNIDLSNNHHLIALDLAYNNIPSINISNLCTELCIIKLTDNPLNCAFDLSFVNRIQDLDVQNCGLTDLILNRNLASYLASGDDYDIRDNPLTQDLFKLLDICAKLPDRTGLPQSELGILGMGTPHYSMINSIMSMKNYSVY